MSFHKKMFNNVMEFVLKEYDETEFLSWRFKNNFNPIPDKNKNIQQFKENQN